MAQTSKSNKTNRADNKKIYWHNYYVRNRERILENCHRRYAAKHNIDVSRAARPIRAANSLQLQPIKPRRYVRMHSATDSDLLEYRKFNCQYCGIIINTKGLCDWCSNRLVKYAR